MYGMLLGNSSNIRVLHEGYVLKYTLADGGTPGLCVEVV